MAQPSKLIPLYQIQRFYTNISEPQSPSREDSFPNESGRPTYILFVIDPISLSEALQNTSTQQRQTSPPQSTPDSDQDLAEKILGAWHERKLITFLPDATWKLQKYEGAPVEPGNFTWSIHNTKLILARDGRTYPETIKFITADQFIVQEDAGGFATYTRSEPTSSTTEQHNSNRQDPAAVEQELNTVYTALRKILDPQTKERLKVEQLKWLQRRANLKTNSAEFIAFTLERTAALKSQLAPSKP
jgi:uncharacterized protein YecT (DUF1311 family)